jgi:hypothetical protein
MNSYEGNAYRIKFRNVAALTKKEVLCLFCAAGYTEAKCFRLSVNAYLTYVPVTRG